MQIARWLSFAWVLQRKICLGDPGTDDRLHIKSGPGHVLRRGTRSRYYRGAWTGVPGPHDLMEGGLCFLGGGSTAMACPVVPYRAPLYTAPLSGSWRLRGST